MSSIGEWSRELTRRCHPHLPQFPADAAGSAWIDADLSDFTKTDTNGLLDVAGSSLGVESTLALNGTVHGRIGTVVDGLFFTKQLTTFDRTKHYGLAIRSAWGNTLSGTWEIYFGASITEAPVADGGVYFGCQLDLSSAVFGNDFGATPTTNQSVIDARYMGGAINLRSDRLDGSIGQNANADRTLRGGQNRTVDPGTAMTDETPLYVMVGIGNQNTTNTDTLTELKVQYQLLAHHGF